MGDALAPRVRAGEFVVVDPDAEPAAGDELVVVMRDGRVAVLQLLARTADMVSMQEITASPKPVTLAPDEIEHMHVVVAIAKPSQWVREV